MKKNLPRFIVTSSSFFEIGVPGGVIAAALTLGGAVILAVRGDFASASILGGIGLAGLLALTYPFYRAYLAPKVTADHEKIVYKTYFAAKSAEKLSKEPVLKGDPLAVDAVDAIWADHQALLVEANLLYEEIQQGRPIDRSILTELTTSIQAACDALRALRDERINRDPRTTRAASRDVTRLLQEEVKSTRTVSQHIRTLSE